MREPKPQPALGFALRDPYPWSDLAALAVDGEEAGFHALFLPEVGTRDTLAALAGLAGVTDRLLLGTGVVPLPSRSPGSLAMAAATVHECSGGRLLLGLGTGPATPGALDRLRSTVLALRAAFAGGAGQIDGVEVRTEPESQGYPNYYRQNFHYQSGGWFTDASARRYEAQVEALFSGAAGAMRRRALSLLARHWRGKDQRGLKLVDLACGSGSFLRDLDGAFPRAAIAGLDLSRAYLAAARSRSRRGGVQANAETLPFADASLDGVTCVYLFHELPPGVRPVVAAEIARVLKPGGVLAFADSVQPVDEPDLSRLLEAFPAYFHEPYYSTYAQTDLPALFGAAGLRVAGQDQAFLTKALLLEKVG